MPDIIQSTYYSSSKPDTNIDTITIKQRNKVFENYVVNNHFRWTVEIGLSIYVNGLIKINWNFYSSSPKFQGRSYSPHSSSFFHHLTFSRRERERFFRWSIWYIEPVEKRKTGRRRLNYKYNLNFHFPQPNWVRQHDLVEYKPKM